MTSLRPVLASVAVGLGLFVAYANLHVEADASPPSRLAPLVEFARSLAQGKLGLGGVVPLRFVEALCGADGRSALLFESARSVRFYAVIGAMPPADAPDPVFVIGAWSEADFEESGFSRRLVSCEPVLRTLGPGEYSLPVAVSLFNGTHLCGGGGFVTEPRLRGSPDDPRLVWMVDPGGKRMELAWPPGSSVRFTPRLEVLNARGDAVAFDGSRAASACGTGDDNAMYVDFWR